MALIQSQKPLIHTCLIRTCLLSLPFFVLVVLSHLTFASATHRIINHATSYPHFQHLRVPRAIKNYKSHSRISATQFEFDQKTNNNDHQSTISLPNTDSNLNSSAEAESAALSSSSIKLKLVHRDKLSVSGRSHHDHRQRFSARIQRDVKRVSGLAHLLDSKTVQSFGSEVISGMDQGSGEYFVRIGVGSPPRSQYMVIDSGSDVVWVQCQPCNQCYRQSDPVFDPSESASYSGVSCGSSVCSRLDHDDSGCSRSGRCKYEVLYSDGSYTKGTLALETLTVGGTSIRNVAIGCGTSNRGMFVGAAGLLGIGGGSMSLVGQLGGQTGGAFSYCLVSRGGGSSGSLVFGRAAMPVGAAWISLLRSQHAPSFYYVGLSGLGVGGAHVPIPEGALTDTVLDTGTAVTRLPGPAYAALRDAFLAQTASLPRAPAASIFDTCYNLGGFVSVRVPTVSFYFTDGPILTLPARNFLIPVNEAGTFCFAFAPSPSGLAIIGNIQQEGIQISVDAASGFVGFGPNVC